MDKLEEHAVVIIGAGPTGLALPIELGSRGVSCLLVERNARVGHAPRAKTTNVRTRTHLRRWGIADRLAAAAPFGIDYPATVSFVTRLGGFKLADIENTSKDASGRPPQDNGVYTSSSFPGCLAPHLWRADGRSLYDLFGSGFTLIHTPAAGAADLRRAAEDARALGAPLTLVEVNAAEAAGRYPAALTLVRPDQFVAWRGQRWTPDILDRMAGWDPAALAQPAIQPARQLA